MDAQQITKWTDSKLEKELTFAEACKNDGPDEEAWFQKLQQEQEARTAANSKTNEDGA